MARCNGRHHRRHSRDNRIIDAEELLKKSGFKMPDPEVLKHQENQLTGEEHLARMLTQFGPLSSTWQGGEKRMMDAERLCELSGDVKPTEEESRRQTERLGMQKSTIMTRRLGIDSDFSTR